MFYWKFLLSLILDIIIMIQAGIIQDKLFNGIVMHIDRLNGECRGHNVPSQGFFQGVKSISTTLFVRNYTLIIKEGGGKKVMAIITVDRCRSKENLDTCEAYFKQAHIDFCKILDPNNLITGKTLKPIHMVPPIKCPFEKGIYHAYNFSYDMTPFLLFTTDGWYWKGKVEFFTPDQKLVYCGHMDGYVTHSKSKQN